MLLAQVAVGLSVDDALQQVVRADGIRVLPTDGRPAEVPKRRKGRPFDNCGSGATTHNMSFPHSTGLNCACSAGFSADSVVWDKVGDVPAGRGSLVRALPSKSRTSMPAFDDTPMQYEVVTYATGEPKLEIIRGGNTWMVREDDDLICGPPLIDDQSRGLGCRCMGSWLYKASQAKGDGVIRSAIASFRDHKLVNGCHNHVCRVDVTTCHESVDVSIFEKAHGSGDVAMPCTLAGKVNSFEAWQYNPALFGDI